MFSTDSSSGPSQVSVTQHFFKTALLNYAVCKKKKKFPQILALEATSIYHLIVSMGRESGSGLAGSFWLRVSPERGLKLLGGELQPHGAGESTSRLAHLAIGRSQFLPECWLDTSVLHHIGLSVGCLTVFVTRQRASLTTEDPRESTIKHSRQKVQSFYNLISEKT